MLTSSQPTIRLTCNSQDSVESLWKKVFERIILKGTEKEKAIGIIKKDVTSEKVVSISELFGKEGFQLKFLDRALQTIPGNPVLIFDEFDRPGENFKKAQFVDHIKNISDNYTNITLFFVGVAETINELIAEHQSLERNLTQIKLPLWKKANWKRFVGKALKKFPLK